MDQVAFEASRQAWDDAAIEAGDWQAAIDRTEAVFEASGVIVHAADKVRSGRTEFVLHSSRISQESMARYGDFASQDVRLAYGLKKASGDVIFDQTIASLRELDRTPIYADLYRRFDFGRFVAVRLDGLKDVGNEALSRTVFFNILRSNRSEAPTAHFLGSALELARTVQRSLRTAAAMRALRDAATATSAGLDLAPFGVVFLRASRAVVDANAAARAQVEANNGLQVSFGILTASDPHSQRALTDALLRTHSTGQPQFCSIRRLGRRPLGVMLVPNPAARGGKGVAASPRAEVIALLVDPEASLAGSKPVWRNLFDFTHAEADVAELLVNGLAPAEIAERREVSFETVRTQCKRICGKVGCDRLPAAIAVLVRCAAAPLV